MVARGLKLIYKRLPEKSKMPSAGCPNCSENVFVEASKNMGDTVLCEECDSKLELVGLDPIELDPQFESDEDYDDGFNIFENED